MTGLLMVGSFTATVLTTELLVSTPASAQTKKAADKAASAKAAAAAAATQVDINNATIDELRALPGIGDAYSKKIVAGRPYARKDQLVSKNILPQGTYDKIQAMIIAKQGGKK